MVSRRAVVSRMVRTLMIGGVCYRNSLTWCCEALRDVLRVGFALASVGVGVCGFVALGGVWHGKSGYFLACCLVRFWRLREV